MVETKTFKKCRFNSIVAFYNDEKTLSKISKTIDQEGLKNGIPVHYVKGTDELKAFKVDFNTLFVIIGPLMPGITVQSLAAFLTKAEAEENKRIKAKEKDEKKQSPKAFIPKLTITSMDHSFVKAFFIQNATENFIDTLTHPWETVCEQFTAAFRDMNNSMCYIDPLWRPIMDYRVSLLERVLPSIDISVCCGLYYKLLTVSIGKNLGNNGHLNVIMQKFSDEDKKPENCLRYIRHIDAAVRYTWDELVRTRAICPVPCTA